MKILTILFVSCLIYLWFINLPKQSFVIEAQEYEKQWVKQRMKYHGIDKCIKDGNRYYFYNNRKERCKL